jgi:hypothetical protein
MDIFSQFPSVSCTLHASVCICFTTLVAEEEEFEYDESGDDGGAGAVVEAVVTSNGTVPGSDAAAHAEHVLALVKETTRGCKTKPYQDPDFPAGPASLDPSPSGELHAGADPIWRRAAEIAYNPKVIVDGFSPDDLCQGGLGNCWFLSALSVVATRPEYLDQLIVTKEVNPAGVYAVRFWSGSKWQEVLLDDYFPVQAGMAWRPQSFASKAKKIVRSEPPTAAQVKDVSEEDANPAKGSFFVPVSVDTLHGQELWPMLLEKAYAKIYGSYAALDGGDVLNALADIVPGSSTSTICMTDEDVIETMKSGVLWRKIKGYNDAGYLMGAGSPTGSDKDISEKGIAQGHAYSILRVATLKDKAGKQEHIVCLRNPW